MNKRVKENIGLILIIILFLSAYLSYLNYHSSLWWDSSVYINMGRYIYSSGNAGLYEASRPLVWPLILGFFWKLGLDTVFFGKIMVLLFGIGTIIITYAISYRLFNKKTALLSALLLAFSPTFFFFNSIIFTEIPSTFFAAFGIYLFTGKNYSLSGLFFGIAFMTRFFQISIILPFFLFFIYLIYNNKSTVREFFIFALFFLIPVVPYLIVNLSLFNNPLYPFFLQAYMSKFTGWIYNQPFDFYFINLVKENILLLFSVFGISIIFSKWDTNKLIIPCSFLFAFIPYNFILHKEMRFLLALFPLLCILASYGIVKFADLFGKYKTFRRHKNMILLLIVAAGVFQIAPQLSLNTYDDKLGPFYDFMQSGAMKNANGIWISNPSFIVYNNAKADELIYYPLYNTKKIMELRKNIDKANYVLINSCDILPCPPTESKCGQAHNNFISLLKEKLSTYLYERSGECEYYIFKRAS